MRSFHKPADLIDEMDENQLRILAKRMARRLDFIGVSSVFGEAIEFGIEGFRPVRAPPYQEIRRQVQSELSSAFENLDLEIDWGDLDFLDDLDFLEDPELLAVLDDDDLDDLDEDYPDLVDGGHLDEDDPEAEMQALIEAQICSNIDCRFADLLRDILEESGEAEAQNLVTGIAVALKDSNIPWEGTPDDQMAYRRAYADIIQKRFRDKEFDTLFGEFDYDGHHRGASFGRSGMNRMFGEAM